jgi:hypothetical protein
MILDASYIKVRKKFYKFNVALSSLKLIYVSALTSSLTFRSKFYFVLLLFLNIQRTFMVSFPRFEYFIKLILSSRCETKFWTFNDASIVIKGWRADKNNQIVLNVDEHMEYLKLNRYRRLRLDVNKVHPNLSIFTGFKSNKIPLNKIIHSRLFTSRGEEGSLSIAGQYNIETFSSLGISLQSQYASVKLTDLIFIDSVKIFKTSSNHFFSALAFVIINYRNLHGVLFDYIPANILRFVAIELENLRELTNVEFFLSSLLGASNKADVQKVKKVKYFLDFKSKNDLLPSIITMNSVTIYPENILVNSIDELVNEISISPRNNFIAHLSNQLYCYGLDGNEALIDINSHDLIRIRETVIYLPCGPINNWFHLIFEGLLPLIYNFNDIDKKIKVIIHQNSPYQFKELLRFVGFNSFYEITSDTVYNFDSLILFQSATKIIDSFSNNQDINLFSLSKDSLVSTHLFFLRKIEKFLLTPNKDFPKKILVLREGMSRGLTNREAVKDYCLSDGYHAITPSRLTVIEQMIYFYSADEIVLEGGSSMANLIFCRVGTKVKYLCSELTADFELISSISSVLCLTLDIIRGKVDPVFRMDLNSIYDVFHSNYKINPKHLKHI